MTRKMPALVICLTLGVVAASGASGGGSDTGSLALNGPLAMVSTPGECPPVVPPETNFCAARVGEGLVPGLGRIAATYEFFVTEGACGTGFRALETTVVLTVAGKGDLHVMLARKDDCLPTALVVMRPFTVTGGTGIYQGASGGGLVDQSYHYTSTGSAGTDTYMGTLNVPGLSFDVTPPTLSGLANKTIRVRRKAKRVRVEWVVTASDQVDGQVLASCTPKSGRRFSVGRTVVRCSATDTSGNTATGRFKVVVKRRR
jgi:HYR domain